MSIDSPDRLFGPACSPKRGAHSSALVLGLACIVPAFAAGPQSWAEAEQWHVAAKSGLGRNLSLQLLALHKAYSRSAAPGIRAKDWLPPTPFRVRDGYVQVTVEGENAAAFFPQLVANGMLDARLHSHSVSGKAPIQSLLEMAAIEGVRSIEPVLAFRRAGLVTTQGDRALRADGARKRFDVDGTGVRVGVLSDSFDCATGPVFAGQMFTRAADDVASNDLPVDIHVLEDLSATPSDACFDEGRAMMQIIHDLAPGAALSFHTALRGQDDFAQGILRLADDGAQVIVDDVGIFSEPMFESGVIGRAVNQVVQRGVAYFSAAGNEARQSYQSPFRPIGGLDLFGEVRHDFDPGAGTRDLQPVTAPPHTRTLIVMNWDQPSISANGLRGSQSDVDIVFYDPDGNPIDFCQTADQLVCQSPGLSDNIVNGNAREFAFIVNDSDEELKLRIGIGIYTGPTPNLIKYVWIDLGEGSLHVDEFDTRSSTIWGHANALGAEAVGAAPWFATRAWGDPASPECSSACLESFSSAGGTPILFDDNGERLTRPAVLVKPGVTGVDGGNTTFAFNLVRFAVPGSTEPDQFPNFFGTSAAAPHVAAVAALMLDKHARRSATGREQRDSHTLAPAIIYSILRATAADIRRTTTTVLRLGAPTNPIAHGRGVDFDSGFGLVDAERALHAVHTLGDD
jgi:subtilisin family serine protease